MNPRFKDELKLNQHLNPFLTSCPPPPPNTVKDPSHCILRKRAANVCTVSSVSELIRLHAGDTHRFIPPSPPLPISSRLSNRVSAVKAIMDSCPSVDMSLSRQVMCLLDPKLKR